MGDVVSYFHISRFYDKPVTTVIYSKELHKKDKRAIN